MRKKFPSSVYNPISLLGTIIALVNFVAILAIVTYDFFLGPLAAYVGIITFIILPSLLFLGLILIPLGAALERRRRGQASDDVKPRSFYFDLSLPAHRRAAIVFLSGTAIFLVATALGSYRAYEFTESVTFCGQICHTVMEPEFTAYQYSPHARVTCAECHVGEGADWYVKSKLSGAYQVYAASFDLFPRPIPTPIENLRPARETCEQCHWPDKFHGSQEKTFRHYMVDEANTPWEIRLLIKTGGGSRNAGIAEGIHWHMNIANEIDYIAIDKQRQEIGWVRIKDLEGNVREYTNELNPIASEDLGNYEMRRMDCIDCHNRPTHIYQSPSRAMNNAFTAEWIDTTLPSAKRIGIESLIGEYTTKDSAFVSIEKQILDAYKNEYPEILEERSDDVGELVSAVKEIYRRNFFPEMKVRWDVYPDNIGHFNSPGCYRCHNGYFVSDAGDTISNDCNSCHTILSQGNGSAGEELISPMGLEFKHPVDIEEAWKEMACSECHTGTSQL
jgi:hypothetical protein